MEFNAQTKAEALQLIYMLEETTAKRAARSIKAGQEYRMLEAIKDYIRKNSK